MSNWLQWIVLNGKINNNLTSLKLSFKNFIEKNVILLFFCGGFYIPDFDFWSKIVVTVFIILQLSCIPRAEHTVFFYYCTVTVGDSWHPASSQWELISRLPEVYQGWNQMSTKEVKSRLNDGMNEWMNKQTYKQINKYNIFFLVPVCLFFSTHFLCLK